MSTKDRILITGGSGLLAINWAYEIRNKYQVVLGMHRRQIVIPGVLSQKLNLESFTALSVQIKEICPKIIIHTAGLTNVERCESDPSLAFLANVTITQIVARVAQNLKIPFILISSDHLFSGKSSWINEAATPEPINTYGRSKAEAEVVALSENDSSLIIRTNFYGWGTSYRHSFSDFIIKSLTESDGIELFDDIFFTPILAKYLIHAAHELINIKESGIFNVVGDTRLSKYDFGIKLANQFGLDCHKIKKTKYAETSKLVQRPLDMSLSNKKITDILGRPLGSVEDHLFELRQQQKEGMTAELGVI